MQRSTARIAGAAAVAVALALTGCTASGDAPDEDLSITIAISPYQFGDALNPQGNHEGAPGLQVMYESMLWKANDTARTNVSEWKPGLAVEWEISDDRREAIFTLREGAEYNDGTPIDAETVVGIMNAWLELPGIKDFEGGVEVEALDDGRVAYRAPEPLGPSNTRMLKALPIVHPKMIEDPEGNLTEPVGSGPYELDWENSVADVSMRLVKIQDHWDADRYPYDEIILTSFADPVAMLNALKSGQADLIDVFVENQEEAMSAGFEVIDSLPLVTALTMADHEGRVLAPIGDVRVRQAINMAFDRETINDTVARGGGYVTSQIFPFQDTAGYLGAGYLEGEDDYYSYDPERAKELMAEAGYPDGFDLVIPTAPNILSTDVSPIVVQYLSDIGIRVTLENFADGGAYYEAIQTGVYPVLIESIYFVDLYGGWFAAESPYRQWFPGYSDPVIDELAEIVVQGTADEQVDAWQELGLHVLEEAWFAPFAYSPRGYAYVPEIEVEIVDLTGVIYPWNIRPAD